MNNVTPWYEQAGPQSDTVISSRIRLARNLSNRKFPNRLSDTELQEVSEKLAERFFAANEHMRDEFTDVQISELSEEEGKAYVEKHLISDELLERPTASRVLLSKDRHISIMLGEEDHMRIQSMRAGLDLLTAYEEAVQIARIFEEMTPIAWHDDYGFLTACPTNTGTGLRASLMVHLPLLTDAKLIPQTVQSLQKLGLTVRGAYGEGSKAQGAIYQISNQMTLGFSEEDLIADLSRVTAQVLAREKDLRAKTYESQPLLMEDKVYRALALLRNSRRMSSDEAMNLISDVRLGVDLGMITDVEPRTLNQLMSNVGKASVADRFHVDEGKLTGQEARARYIRETLAAVADDLPEETTDNDKQDSDKRSTE